MALQASRLNLGDTHQEEVVNNLSRTQIVQYAGASGDYNPVHTDELFTREIAGYPSVFAHGMLTMGMTGKISFDQQGKRSDFPLLYRVSGQRIYQITH